MKHYLDPRSLSRLTGFALIMAGLAAAFAKSAGDAQWAVFVGEVVGSTPPALLITNGLGVLGIRAAQSKMAK